MPQGARLGPALVARLRAYMIPPRTLEARDIGGGGRSALAGPGALNIADAKRFQLDDVVRFGPDVRLTATPLQ